MKKKELVRVRTNLMHKCFNGQFCFVTVKLFICILTIYLSSKFKPKIFCFNLTLPKVCLHFIKNY